MMSFFATESKAPAIVAGATSADSCPILGYKSGLMVDTKSASSEKPETPLGLAVFAPHLSLMTRDSMRKTFGSREHRFRMSTASDLITTAGGVLLSFVPLSPAVVTYNEWAGLSALFDEVKLIAARITIRPLVGSDGQALGLAAATKVFNNDVWYGFDNTNVSTPPASFASVYRLDGASPAPRCIGDHGTSVLTVRARKGLNWASTLTPAVSSPPAGVLGSFNFAAASSLSNSTIYYYVVMHTEVVMRCRI